MALSLQQPPGIAAQGFVALARSAARASGSAGSIAFM